MIHSEQASLGKYWKNKTGDVNSTPVAGEDVIRQWKFHAFGSKPATYFNIITLVIKTFRITLQKIIYIGLFIFNGNRVDTRWQQYSTQLHTNCTQNTENGTYITIKEKIWEVQAVLRICKLYSGICLTTEEKARIQACIDTRGHHFQYFYKCTATFQTQICRKVFAEQN
jgi:hypothetical protein